MLRMPVVAGRGLEPPLAQPRVLLLLPLVLGLLLGPRQVTHEHAEHAQVEEQAGQYERAPAPTVVAEQLVIERREYKRADAAAADGQPGGQRPFLVEVIRDDDDGSHVAQRQPEPGYQAERDEQHEQRVGERGYDEAGGRDHGPDDGDLLAAVPVGQEAGDGPGQQGHGHEQRADPRGLALALVEVLLELDEYDAERERHAVRDHVHHERREHHDPAPAAVRRAV